jgi:hypothetical protein
MARPDGLACEEVMELYGACSIKYLRLLASQRIKHKESEVVLSFNGEAMQDDKFLFSYLPIASKVSNLIKI